VDYRKEFSKEDGANSTSLHSKVILRIKDCSEKYASLREIVETMLGGLECLIF
jgi:hypothetical protein